MRASLSLHLALFRRQKAQISRSVEGYSKAFRAYEARYRSKTRSYQKVISSADVARQVAASDVVYVGDYHTLRSAQESYLELLRHAEATGRRVVVALEFIEGRRQKALDQYLAGKLSERRFLATIGRVSSGNVDLWPGFKPMLAHARQRGLTVVGIDRPAIGSRSLALRDAYAAARIAEVARAKDRPLVMVLMGQFHVAPCHLPEQTRLALGPGNERKHLVVYQNCEGIYWRLAQRGQAGRVEAVQLRPGEVCLLNTSPVICQQRFLDYLDAEAGDELLGDRGATQRFHEMARMIGSFAGVDIRSALAEVEVATAADLDLMARIKRRGRFNRKELEQVRRHILSRESYYIPRAKLAYLATLSLNHAAEEAAHFVRHSAVGEAMHAPRTLSDAFYARCLEEALGFFGSKLINPGRRCRDLAQWAAEFEARRGEDRQIAAFVLAHKAAEAEGADEASKLLPLRADRLFHAVSHALGYMLADALYLALDAGELEKKALRQLFRDPFVDARARYFQLSRAE
jgi:hypothetical protein